MKEPLVSILIPTHNRLDLFKIAFQSALNQTYKKIEIIISDDSDNDNTYKYMQPFLLDKRIKYQWNKNFNALNNWRWLIERCSGKYFNFLMDDDVFSLNKIEKMVEVYESNPTVSLVTSYRQPIDINGKFLPNLSATEPIVKTSTIIPGRMIAEGILKSCSNFIGEPTTVLIKNKYQPLMKRLIERQSPIGDIIMWLELCKDGEVAYLTDTLSYFRIHEGNDQNRPIRHLAGLGDWCRLYDQAYGDDWSEDAKKEWLQKYINIMNIMIDLWYKLLSDPTQDKGECAEYKHYVDDVVECYLDKYDGILNVEGRYNFKRYADQLKIKRDVDSYTTYKNCDMKAVILSGDYGRILGDKSQCQLKSMMELDGMPILWHIIKNLSVQGIKEFVICAGYKQQIIKEWFNNYLLFINDVTFDYSGEKSVTLHYKNEDPWKVTVVDTGRDAMVGRQLKRIKSYIDDKSDFLLTFGDVISDVNVGKLINFHKENGKIATLATVLPEQTKGVLSPSLKREKKCCGKTINVGYMMLNKKIFDYLTDDDCIFEKESLQLLSQKGELMYYKHHGFLLCIDTLLEKQILEEMLEKGVAPWKNWDD